MRISDWSSVVCSSDLGADGPYQCRDEATERGAKLTKLTVPREYAAAGRKAGMASRRRGQGMALIILPPCHSSLAVGHARAWPRSWQSPFAAPDILATQFVTTTTAPPAPV